MKYEKIKYIFTIVVIVLFSYLLGSNIFYYNRSEKYRREIEEYSNIVANNTRQFEEFGTRLQQITGQLSEPIEDIFEAAERLEEIAKELEDLERNCNWWDSNNSNNKSVTIIRKNYANTTLIYP